MHLLRSMSACFLLLAFASLALGLPYQPRQVESGVNDETVMEVSALLDGQVNVPSAEMLYMCKNESDMTLADYNPYIQKLSFEINTSVTTLSLLPPADIGTLYFNAIVDIYVSIFTSIFPDLETCTVVPGFATDPNLSGLDSALAAFLDVTNVCANGYIDAFASGILSLRTVIVDDLPIFTKTAAILVPIWDSL